MESLHILIERVNAARMAFLDATGSVSPAQGEFEAEPGAWSMSEIGELVHPGRSIEEVVATTWGEKVQVPAVTAPKWGGPFVIWAAALRACQPVLEELGRSLEGEDLSQIVYPHPISGPLDARQRLEFLRFHPDRHAEPIRRVRAHAEFPRS